MNTAATKSNDILIIDDDDSLNTLLKEYFFGFGFILRAATSAQQGLLELRRKLPKILILDIMLPDDNGLTLCREIRTKYNFPIIMLSARGELSDKVLG